MENRKNLCAMIPESLHTQVRTEQEQMELTLSQYMEMVLKQHFENGGKNMANGATRTLAFQVPEELFERVKAHLKATGLNQKEFVIGLIEKALQEAEAETQPEKEAAQGAEAQAQPEQDTAGQAEAETLQEDAQGEPA